MEFDKRKVLTVVTADQAKAGYKGWFADVLTDLESRANNDAPDFIKNIDLSGKTRYPFKSALIGGDWSLFYPDPAPEPTYDELQAEWVKANNVKCGTKVRILKSFTDKDIGEITFSTAMPDEGVFGTISSIGQQYIEVVTVYPYDNATWKIPFMAVEVIKETIRPFNDDELNNLVGKIVRNKQTGYRKLVTGKPNTSLGVNLEGKYICAKDLLNSFMMDDGKSPCGVKEEV
jgi:hypothetical protein